MTANTPPDKRNLGQPTAAHLMVGFYFPLFVPRITLIEPLGSHTLIFLEAQGQEIRPVIQGEFRFKEGESVHVTFQMEKRRHFSLTAGKI